MGIALLAGLFVGPMDRILVTVVISYIFCSGTDQGLSKLPRGITGYGKP